MCLINGILLTRLVGKKVVVIELADIDFYVHRVIKVGSMYAHTVKMRKWVKASDPDLSPIFTEMVQDRPHDVVYKLELM